MWSNLCRLNSTRHFAMHCIAFIMYQANLNAIDLYVSTSYGSLLKFSPDMNISTVATGWGGYQIVCDNSGIIYGVSDQSSLLSVFDTSTFTKSYRTISGVTTFNLRGLALGPDGVLYASNKNDASIYKINPSTGVATLLASNHGMIAPSGLAFDQQWQLYVANEFGGSISKVNISDGSVTSLNLIGDSTLIDPIGMVIDKNNNLFVSSSRGDYFTRIDLANNTAHKLSLTGGNISGPHGLALHPNTNELYYASYFNAYVGKISITGNTGSVTDLASNVWPISMVFYEVPEPRLPYHIIATSAMLLICCRNMRAAIKV